MFRHSIIICVVWACAILSGCGQPDTYDYEGFRYLDPQQALDAQRASHEKTLAKIPPLSQPLAGKALVILPTREIWKVQATGGGSVAVPKKLEEYIRTAKLREEELLAKAIQKRGAFKEVVVQQNNQPDSLLGGDYDAIIYKSPGLKQLYVKIRTQTTPVPIHTDESLREESEKIVSSLKYMESLLAGQ